MFGGGGPSGDPSTLFFTDGINGETDGLFGALTVPEPWTWAMMLVGFGSLALFAARRHRLSDAPLEEPHNNSSGSFLCRSGETETGPRRSPGA
jgi:PEP-CTERM motif